jgi:hypothetical protein
LLAQKRLLHETRGRILSDKCDLEEVLEFAITRISFRQRHPRVSTFNGWFLSAVMLDAKIGIVRNIVEELDLSDRMSSLIPELQAAKDVRNRQAHAKITWELLAKRPAQGSGEPFVPWKSMRASRKGPQERAVDRPCWLTTRPSTTAWVRAVPGLRTTHRRAESMALMPPGLRPGQRLGYRRSSEQRYPNRQRIPARALMWNGLSSLPRNFLAKAFWARRDKRGLSRPAAGRP